jgi:diaminohydroxyphosphoribosylaminopyrimidine deaminase/5-amino-6-(5-phosphoribosylamino)uracil reductase
MSPDKNKPLFSENDRYWMQYVLELAAKGAGHVSPNPMVGCVILSSDGHKIGEGWHEQYGSAHAEINALRSVKNKTQLQDATVYVNLEPCAHHGKTPPCAEALAGLPLKRVVVAMEDPNPKVNGTGLALLRAKGIQVEVGLLENEAKILNEVFLHRIRYGKTWVLLKIAQSLDGHINTGDEQAGLFSHKESQRLVHQWRAQNDGVMIGSGTALKDNPRLTVRHVSGRQPKRVVIDGKGLLPDDLWLFKDQYSNQTIRVTHTPVASTSTDPLLELMMKGSYPLNTLQVANKKGYCDLNELLYRLPEYGIHSLLVEGGQQLSTALLREQLVDKLAIFITPKLFGGGPATFAIPGGSTTTDIIQLNRVNWKPVGDDLLCTAYL